MRETLRQLSIAGVLLILALAAVAGRLGLFERLGRNAGPDLSPPGPLCAGFDAADGGTIGIAYGSTADELVAAGIARLGLPRTCSGLALPSDLEAGALIRLRLADGGCRVASIERLPGPQRLVCGTGIDVNRDAARDIELLPGIGPKKASAIAESRRRDGPFGSLDELARVKGVGAKTVERIRPWAQPPDERGRNLPATSRDH